MKNYILTEKEIKEFERRIKGIIIRMIDSEGYYVLASREEEMLASTFHDKCTKLIDILSRELNLFCKIISHENNVFYSFGETFTGR